ncbi:DoxX family protein [Pyxidicoccus fallax]|uniref:DoxX family protein n=1 Tax=Pyxidicoccus fallax TaxID=394095 RepID=A0A848LV34_9BACT|nr:DoxX family protein [Pyxidicoccus fallax]NMO21491.1 DoxX family protein [Pyxidicoccus fallax]NPC82770.1 DoxX family protein [Pyxidicoccus fallax]
MSVFAKWGPRVARVVLGLPFFVIGLSHFIPFLPPQPPPPPEALPFVTGLGASGYIMPMVKGIEVVAGLALLTNRFVPLALTLLAPIIINIAGFHFALAPSYPLPITFIVLSLYLAWSYRAAFAPMLRARVEPTASASETSVPRQAVPAR